MHSDANTPAGAPPAALPARLDRILRDTSRSIYLTLRLAPAPMRRQVMLGYLFCRAADSIADTRALPPARRREMLDLYRAQFAAPSADPAALAAIAAAARAPDAAGGARAGVTEAEADLLGALEECFALHAALDEVDRALLSRLLATLTQGMAMDLAAFPSEEDAEARGAVAALASDGELDRYCYHVAGCVGEFWSDLQAAHLAPLAALDSARMRALGVRFGKGLQMTNVLRDMPADLRRGRCYVPAARLEEAGVTAAELRAAAIDGDSAGAAALAARLGAALDDLLDLAVAHLEAGLEYTLAVPRRLVFLRLACVLPLLLGLDTLRLLRRRRVELLAGARLKVSRARVHALLVEAGALALWDRGLAWCHRRLARRASREAWTAAG